MLGPAAPASLPCWLCCDADCCCEGAGTGAANAVVVVVPVKPAELFMALCKIALPNQEDCLAAKATKMQLLSSASPASANGRAQTVTAVAERQEGLQECVASRKGRTEAAW